MLQSIHTVKHSGTQAVSINLVPLWSQINAPLFNAGSTASIEMTRCGSDYAGKKVGFREGWDD
jgi:hypothetical protein